LEEAVKYVLPNPEIVGWMDEFALQWLYAQAQTHRNIVELGSWRGRSTHALCSGTQGMVTAVDHFNGQAEYLDNEMVFARDNDLFAEFKKNVGHFSNLRIKRGNTAEMATGMSDVDMLFVDAGHDFDAVMADLTAWAPTVIKGGLICGHDYGFYGVKAAIENYFGYSIPRTMPESTIWSTVKQ
jgi:predicted O-methyltransferase YrrM